MSDHRLLKEGSQERSAHLRSNSVRRRMRALLVWTYVAGVIGSSLAYVVRDWDGAQVKWLTEWGLLFMSPAAFAATIQYVRRRLAVADSGKLLVRFPAQRTSKLPNWILGVVVFVLAAAPFSVLLFKDGHVVLVVAFAFAGVMLFSMAWLWFDGIPLEIREQALVIDGLLRINWQQIESAETLKRSNVVLLRRLEPDMEEARELEVFVCAEDRFAFIETIDKRRNGLHPLNPNDVSLYQHDEGI